MDMPNWLSTGVATCGDWQKRERVLVWAHERRGRCGGAGVAAGVAGAGAGGRGRAAGAGGVDQGTERGGVLPLAAATKVWRAGGAPGGVLPGGAADRERVRVDGVGGLGAGVPSVAAGVVR